MVDRHAPDVVLMDIRMPNMDGLAATEALRARRHAPEVIILTTFDADEHVLRALRAGAAGFVLKDTPPAEIVDAVRRVAQGLPVLSPAVTRRLIARVAGAAATTGRARAPGPWPCCNDREREVAVAVGQGRSNAEIGLGPLPQRPHRQDPRLEHPHQARPQQPGPDRPAGPRRRAARRGRVTRPPSGAAGGGLAAAALRQASRSLTRPRCAGWRPRRGGRPAGPRPRSRPA